MAAPDREARLAGRELQPGSELDFALGFLSQSRSRWGGRGGWRSDGRRRDGRGFDGDGVARGAPRPAGVPAEDEPAEDVLDLDVSAALVDAMLKLRPEPEGSGFVRPGAAEHSAVEDAAGDDASGAQARVEALLALLGVGSSAVAPGLRDAGRLPGDSRETAAVRVAVEALREAVGGRAQAGGGSQR